MPQSLTQKAVNNFVRGLITEAAELTFPEGASVDELNCDLRRDGTRRRRLGAEIEEGAVQSSFTINDSDRINSDTWVNVGGNPELEFLVVQHQNTLYFYNKADTPYSAQEKANSVDLSSYEQAGSSGAENSDCQFASLKGKLVVSSPGINTILIEYDDVTDTFSVTQIDFKVRDFEYQGSTEDYLKKTTGTTATDARIYDTLNSGWAEENIGNNSFNALSIYRFQDANKYPSLTLPYYSGKSSSGQFDLTTYEQVGGGTSLSGNGRYILDFFNQNRQAAVSNDGGAYGFSIGTGLNKTITTRFSCVESFSGRIFYAGLGSSEDGGKILFSKLIENDRDFGACHQANDPTSEYYSDLLDTDGGVIDIPDAINIKKLFALQSSIYVFAENGVWQINGVDGVFKATAYAVSRVSRVGLLSAGSFVAAENAPFWWSRFGIHTLTSDPVSGVGQEQNLTISTIQTFWDAIGYDEKLKVKSVYDSINKRIYWAYPDNGETRQAKINNILILDIPLQAFYPWRISDYPTVPLDYVVGLAFYSGYGAKPIELDVTTSAGGDVVTLDYQNVDFTYTAGSATGTITFNVDSHSLSVSDSITFANFSQVFSDPFGLFPDFDSSNLNSGTYTVTATTATSFTVSITYEDVASFGGSLSTPQDATDQTYNGIELGSLVDDVVSTQVSTFNTGDAAIVLLVRDRITNTTGKLVMGGFTSKSFLDFGITDYSSYAETGYDFVGDLVTKKNTPYLVVYSRLTEEGFTGNEVSGYETVRPSSLLVSTAWDFKETFSTGQQAYRLKYPVAVNPNDLTEFDYPDSVVTTRLKIRGHGRSMRIRYESEQGKDFLLLGWGIIQGRNPRY